MAKGNMLLGYSRGKVGDLVFKRVNGKQVTVPRVRVISNPKTDAQTITRIALSSASKTAQHLRQLVNHSFQGIEYGQRSVNHFVSQLSKELQADIKAALASTSSVDPYRAAPVLPNAATNVASGAALLVSRGDLDSPRWEFNDDTYWGISVDSEITFAGLSALTVSQFCALLHGDISTQFTFVGGSVNELDYISEEELFYGSNIDYARINFLADAAALPAFINYTANAVKLNPAALDMTRTDERALNWEFGSYDDVIITMGIGMGASSITSDIFGRSYEDWCSFGIIASKYENNAWRRSTCRLSIKNQVTALGYIDKDGWNDIDSVMTLMQTSKSVSEDEYLNKEKKKQ